MWLKSPLETSAGEANAPPQFQPANLPVSSTATRVGALSVLCIAVVCVAYVVYSAYRAATDSFVAPIILSPDNDIVIAHKKMVLEIDGQRALAQAQAESVDADLAATEAAEQRLLQLQELTAADLDAIGRQRGLLREMFDRQRQAAQRAKLSLEAGLILQADYDRELQNLRQAEIALLENSRAKTKAQAPVGGLGAIEGPIAAHSKSEKLAQIELELLRVHAEKKAKQVERQVLSDKILKLQDLETQLRKRPLFAAIKGSVNAAFVPYTQMDGISAGAAVFSCTWGLFNCTGVGVVAEVVAGEAMAPDPWGTPARGQYILLNLKDPKAATAKVLRVRP